MPPLTWLGPKDKPDGADTVPDAEVELLQDAGEFIANTRALKRLLASNNVKSEAQRLRSAGFRNWFRQHGLRALSPDQDSSWPLATQLKVCRWCLAPVHAL